MMSVGCQLDWSPALGLSVGSHPRELRLCISFMRLETPLSPGLATIAPAATYYQRLAPCAPAAPRNARCHQLCLLTRITRHFPRHPAISRH
jgi:hypothetical protein